MKRIDTPRRLASRSAAALRVHGPRRPPVAARGRRSDRGGAEPRPGARSLPHNYACNIMMEIDIV